jgi:hypothetical protein
MSTLALGALVFEVGLQIAAARAPGLLLHMPRFAWLQASYRAAGQWDYMARTLMWAGQYLVKCVSELGAVSCPALY